MLHAFVITLYNMEIANVSYGKIPHNSSVMNKEGGACFF